MQALQALLASSKKRRRAVVSLPTGGGKTRVTVEASVRLVLVPEGDSRSVIWVAVSYRRRREPATCETV
jgi:superfamily II DNA or RNA helicase